MAQQIDGLLRAILKKNTNNWKLTLLRDWHDIVGSLGTKVSLEKVYEDTLVLGVLNSAWMQELYLLSDMLIATINQKLDRPRIKQIRFKRLSIKKHTERKPPTRRKKCTVVTFTPQEQKKLESIEDPQLRSALQKFLVRCYQERENENDTIDRPRSDNKHSDPRQ